MPSLDLGAFFNNTSVGAFLGSFSAFILGLLTYVYTKKRERWVVHQNTVVSVEHLLNRNLTQIYDNIFLIKGMISTFKRVNITDSILAEIENPPLATLFLNEQLVNSYIDYSAFVEKTNHDVKGINRSNDRVYDMAISKRLPHEQVINQLKYNIENLELMVAFLEDLLNETYTLGGLIRAFSNKHKLDIFARFNPTKKIQVTFDEIAEERAIFLSESEETIAREKNGRLAKIPKVIFSSK